jgi:hypothetical protein
LVLPLIKRDDTPLMVEEHKPGTRGSGVYRAD